jgi:FixJ family two-component response regulator
VCQRLLPLIESRRASKHARSCTSFAIQAFSSAEAFLASACVAETRCLILDIAMPGMSGPQLQQELVRRRHHIPIVFITASEDRDVRLRLIAAGAVECLFKALTVTALLTALNQAVG